MVHTPPPATISADAPEISDAISLLRRDHGIVALLFDEFDRIDGPQRDPIARRICKILNVHAQIEEEIFYPAARMALRENDSIDAAIADHARAKQLITDIEAMTTDNSLLVPAMRELTAVINEHVAEEERLFSRLKDAPLDLEGLGAALAVRKVTLMEVMGLHYDDELPARPENRGHGGDAPPAR